MVSALSSSCDPKTLAFSVVSLAAPSFSPAREILFLPIYAAAAAFLAGAREAAGAAPPMLFLCAKCPEGRRNPIDGRLFGPENGSTCACNGAFLLGESLGSLLDCMGCSLENSFSGAVSFPGPASFLAGLGLSSDSESLTTLWALFFGEGRATGGAKAAENLALLGDLVGEGG